MTHSKKLCVDCGKDITGLWSDRCKPCYLACCAQYKDNYLITIYLLDALNIAQMEERLPYVESSAFLCFAEENSRRRFISYECLDQWCSNDWTPDELLEQWESALPYVVSDWSTEDREMWFSGRPQLWSTL